jgi:peptidoglycan hydrolase-like protein with peptidoglycan-binding domain
VAPTTVAPTTVPVPATPPPPQLLAPLAPLQPSRPGQGGDNIANLQQRLLQLGFWLDNVDRRYGAVTTQAVMAFQKHHGLAADGIAGPNTTALLNQPLPHVQGKATSGDLIEVDKAKQVLYIVRGGVAAWAINTSTGTGAEFTEFSEKEQREISGTSVTPEGDFRVNRERPDGWWTGELGDLYRPKYFRGGVAVHGSNRIPNYPASHGCVRVSVAAMDYIWAENIMPMKSAVWVHAG